MRPHPFRFLSSEKGRGGNAKERMASSVRREESFCNVLYWGGKSFSGTGVARTAPCLSIPEGGLSLAISEREG